MKKLGARLVAGLAVSGSFLSIGLILANEPSSPPTIEQTQGPNKGVSTITDPDKKATTKQIWSPNREFYVILDPHNKTITVYGVDWQGKTGRSKKLWVMDGWFEVVCLSNDGEHLVASQATNSLPLDYEKDEVMLSFFRCGGLITEIRLRQLITDFSKLQRTNSGYHWGKYLGLNAAGYYVVETVEGRKILFCVKTGRPTILRSEKKDKFPKWKSYEDIMRCYEFQYPDDYLLKEHLAYDGTSTGYLLLERRNRGWVVKTSIDEIAAYPREYYDPAKMSFEEFAINRAKAICSADGPDGSRYATDVVRKEIFKNTYDLEGIEIYLLEVIETYLVDSKEQKTDKRVKGPIYAVAISQPNEPHRSLFFELNDEVENSSQEKQILKKIVSTVRILR